MIFIEQVLSDVLIFDCRLEHIHTFKSAVFVVQNDRVLVKNQDRILADLPLQSVGILYI